MKENEGVKEIALDVAGLLRDEILKEKDNFKNLSLTDKLDKFIKLMSAMKESKPLINMAIPISFDPSRVERAERVLNSEENVRKLLKEPRTVKEKQNEPTTTAI